MRIVIVGPGALGCLIAGLIRHKTKEDVWLLDKSPERARRIAADAISVEGISGPFAVKVNATADPGEIGRCDLIMMCVKSYSTEEACRQIKELARGAASILTLQNGIGNMQTLDDHFGADRVIGGVTSQASTLVGVGHVRHAGRGETVIGRADGRVLGAVRDVAAVLGRIGFDAKVTRDIDSVIWGKLVINAGINAISAITRLPNGLLVDNEECRQLVRTAVQESVKVVKRKRIKLSYDDPIQKVESVCKATAGNASSMLQDVIGSRRTEIDYINGAIVRQAKALGIATPVNEALTALVRTIEMSYGKGVNRQQGG